MEKDPQPPQEIPAPPYPGPPVNHSYPTQPGPQPGFPGQPVYLYNPQQPQIIQPVAQVVMVQQLPTDAPAEMVCPTCRNTIITKIEYRNGFLTWLLCGLLGIFVCWPCCLIPFCVDACKDVEHSCPSCNTVLHIHQRR
ncbi:LITAF domain-containing protein-like [Thunnus albacares]|uniref:LITAF domain-containing protein-like n=1 Tax=Thunnus albacares TaxID=8236 RepID=UPI001CF62CEC|nr:LITAF domain-containing protein-like [Thunnus albacares]